MPYIEQEQRAKLDRHIETLVNAIVSETGVDFCGDLIDATPTMNAAGLTNYALTKVLVGVMNRVAPIFKQPNYGTYALFAGVLSHMQMEIYRRLTSKYEDKKISENGDLTELSVYDNLEW